MKVFDAAQVRAALPYPALVEALAAAFRAEVTMPERHVHELAVAGEPDGALLIMPAWSDDRLGVKVLTLMPGNATRNQPTIAAGYLLHELPSGRPIAWLDGAELTARRTVGSSALAGRHLARGDARRLAIMGSGRLAREAAHAWAAVRPIAEVAVWARNHDKATLLAAELASHGFAAEAVERAAEAARWADIITCVTAATEPVLHGDWLRPGAHVDLVGSYRPNTRECDDRTVQVATLFVDTRAGALAEAGDLLIPMGKGVIGAEAVQADLFDLCRGTHPGRRRPDEITLFKSVGAALEDLAAARLVAG